MKKYRNY